MDILIWESAEVMIEPMGVDEITEMENVEKSDRSWGCAL